MSLTLDKYLSGVGERFTPERGLIRERVKGTGYSSKIPRGSEAHGTRISADYAIALLQRGRPADCRLAEEVLGALLMLQDTDPLSPTFGVWPWFAEESLAEMNPPDLNWADFIGARLAQIVIEHGNEIDSEARANVCSALRRAAASIFRRNVSLGYTNIAVMGAGVCVLAGEILGDELLVEYGRLKLGRLVDRTNEHGGFSEYNSPAYTMVVLEECERILQLASDPEARRQTESLRVQAWQTIAEHFHVGTGQWAGPHSRSYSQVLDGRVAAYLARQTGAAITPHPRATADEHFGLVRPIECPASLRDAFHRPAEADFTRRFLLREAGEDSVSGTTWMNAEACLGSVNRDTMRDQRRVVLAYWKTDRDPAVMLRLRFLKNGRDFASAFVRNAQRGPRVLSAVNLLTNQGDVYPFDRPESGRFAVSDFRVVYELTGEGVHSEELGRGRFALCAGNWKAVIHTMPGQFGEFEVNWQTGGFGEVARVEGVCYSGEERSFDLAGFDPIVLAFGMELLPVHENPLEVSPTIGGNERGLETPAPFLWSLPEPLVLHAPTKPEFYPYLLSASKV